MTIQRRSDPQPSPETLRLSERTSALIGFKDGAVRIDVKVSVAWQTFTVPLWIEPEEIRLVREVACKAEAWLALPRTEREARGIARD